MTTVTNTTARTPNPIVIPFVIEAAVSAPSPSTQAKSLSSFSTITVCPPFFY